MWNFKKFFFFLFYNLFLFFLLFFFNITTYFSSLILISMKYLDLKVLKFIVASEILMNACMHEAVETDGAWTVNQQWGQTRGRI